ncbi:hypothetical protein AB6A40_003567 [Gnathostoma spinigerum]|uniref:SAP domain-containing protein n=1 Tax=Gnathostoma spinigerum TaxID=75299 RepID=A0ABD6EIR4_9BILA
MPDKLDLLVNGRPLSELKVVELKDELGKRGLSKIGNKTTLCDRMKGVLVEEAAAKAKSEQETRPTASPRKEDVVPPAANPIVAEYLAVQQAALEEARKNAGGWKQIHRKPV